MFGVTILTCFACKLQCWFHYWQVCMYGHWANSSPYWDVYNHLACSLPYWCVHNHLASSLPYWCVHNHLACFLPYWCVHNHLACSLPYWCVHNHQACSLPYWCVHNHLACSLPYWCAYDCPASSLPCCMPMVFLAFITLPRSGCLECLSACGIRQMQHMITSLEFKECMPSPMWMRVVSAEVICQG